jgi:hypothetical protein
MIPFIAILLHLGHDKLTMCNVSLLMRRVSTLLLPAHRPLPAANFMALARFGAPTAPGMGYVVTRTVYLIRGST